MLVKICGITSQNDALLAVALGADALGFNFTETSPRRIAPSKARDITKQVPGGVISAGVFANQSRDTVVRTVDEAGLTTAQLHGKETPDDCRWVAERVKYVIKAFTAGDPAITHIADYGVTALMLDGPNPGEGKVFDWHTVEGSRLGLPWILAGGLTPENVGEAISIARPTGVDVASGVEYKVIPRARGDKSKAHNEKVESAKPGEKDPMRLRAFLKAARQAERESGLAPPVPIGTPLPPTSEWGNLDAFSHLVRGQPGQLDGAERAAPDAERAPPVYDWRDE